MKKALVIALAAGLAAALSIPAGAQEAAEATVVPEAVNIEDPAGDANYLNGQGSVPDQEDHVTPADAGSVSDLLKVWFTNDAEFVRVHVLTEAPPPASGSAYIYRIHVDPGVGEPCLWFQILTEGPTNPAGAFGNLRDTCDGNDQLFEEGVTVNFEETADGQGISTISVPRALYAGFIDGAVLNAPIATVRNFINGNPVRTVTAPQIDDTKPGTAYTIVAEEPPPPPFKKGCPKGSVKAKKRGCRK